MAVFPSFTCMNISSVHSVVIVRGKEARASRLFAPNDDHRMDRADVHAGEGGEYGHLYFRAVGAVRVFDVGGAVRELEFAAGGDSGRAAVPFVVAHWRGGDARR